MKSFLQQSKRPHISLYINCTISADFPSVLFLGQFQFYVIVMTDFRGLGHLRRHGFSDQQSHGPTGNAWTWGMYRTINRIRKFSKPWMRVPRLFQQQQEKERNGDSMGDFPSLHVYPLSSFLLYILQDLLSIWKMSYFLSAIWVWIRKLTRFGIPY